MSAFDKYVYSESQIVKKTKQNQSDVRISIYLRIMKMEIFNIVILICQQKLIYLFTQMGDFTPSP